MRSRVARQDPENANKLWSQLYEPTAAGGAELALIRKENDKWSKLIQQLGMRID
jgi:hypothetical protein